MTDGQSDTARAVADVFNKCEHCGSIYVRHKGHHCRENPEPKAQAHGGPTMAEVESKQAAMEGAKFWDPDKPVAVSRSAYHRGAYHLLDEPWMYASAGKALKALDAGRVEARVDGIDTACPSSAGGGWWVIRLGDAHDRRRFPCGHCFPYLD